MDRETYLGAINAGGVDHANVRWTTTVKPAAAHAARTLRKSTNAVVMTGVSYSDLAVNADTETGALPWGEWAVYPHIIAHKGADYARLYTVDGTLRTVYTVDGEVVDRDEFNGYLTPSAARADRPKGGCITVKLENLRVLEVR